MLRKLFETHPGYKRMGYPISLYLLLSTAYISNSIKFRGRKAAQCLDTTPSWIKDVQFATRDLKPFFRTPLLRKVRNFTFLE